MMLMKIKKFQKNIKNSGRVLKKNWNNGGEKKMNMGKVFNKLGLILMMVCH